MAMDDVAEAGRRPRLPSGMSRDTVQARLDAMAWHQAIDFGDGLVARPERLQETRQFADALFQGLDLRGKSVLDVGAWNGAYSFAAEARGARRVLATDHFTWTHPVFKGRETSISPEACWARRSRPSSWTSPT